MFHASLIVKTKSDQSSIAVARNTSRVRGVSSQLWFVLGEHPSEVRFRLCAGDGWGVLTQHLDKSPVVEVGDIAPVDPLIPELALILI